MNSALYTNGTGVFGTYANNYAGYYGLPLTLGQQHFMAPTSNNNYADLNMMDQRYNLRPQMPYTYDGRYIWDSTSEGDNTSEPTAKRRRLSVQSDDSVPDSLSSGKVFPVQGITTADFIQHSFAPRVEQRSESAPVNNIEPDNILSRILQYNENMVRKFPQKKRTAKEQERRDKNTLACRVSRCKEKIKNFAIEEQQKLFTQQTFELTKAAMQRAAYLNELLKYGALVRHNELNTKVVDDVAKKLNLKPLDNIPTKIPAPETTKNGKRPFSMAFLLGTQ